MQFPSSEPRVLNGIDNGGKLYFLEGGGPRLTRTDRKDVEKIILDFICSTVHIGLSDEGGKATSPAQIPNLILPICGSGRPPRASEPPPNNLPGRILG